MLGARQGDIILSVSQRNADKDVIIEEVRENNAALTDLLEFTPDEILHESFRKILPERINGLINDYLEFEDAGNDLQAVLSKTRNFGLLSKSGEKVDLSIRIQTDVCVDEHARYMVILGNKNPSLDPLLKALEACAEDHVMDDITGLPNSDSFLRSAQVAHECVSKGTADVGVAVIRIDRFRNILSYKGQDTADGLLREVVLRCRQVFRDTDVVGYLGEGKFAVLLLKADKGNTLVPLNRLKNQIANLPLFVPGNEDVTATLSIAYTVLTADVHADATISKCEEVILSSRETHNQLLAIE